MKVLPLEIMSDIKPFIFIEPLSDTLLKLKEVIAETASEEGIEIFTIEDILEANQLIPTIGQSLIVCSNPKKCAAILQSNRKFLAEHSSKVLLLTPKVIPKKTLEKFMKVGLTECIIEPVPSKTLLYKVKLLLRSIAAKREEHDMEMKSVKSDESASIDYSEKQRIEKGISADSSSDESLPTRKEKVADIEMDYEIGAVKSANKADQIDGHWAGELSESQKKKEQDNLSGEGQSADHLESHYKGKLGQDSIEQVPENLAKKKLRPEEEIDYDDFKKGADIELDFNLDDIKERLKAQEDRRNGKSSLSNDSQVENIQTHYKGKVALSAQEQDEYDDLAAAADIELDFDSHTTKPLRSQQDDPEDAPSPKAPKIDFNFEETSRKKQKQEQQGEDQESEKTRSVSLEFEEDPHAYDRRQESEGQADKDPHTGEVDHIETYLKGHLDHQSPQHKYDDELRERKKESEDEFEEPERSRGNDNIEAEEDLYERSALDFKLSDAQKEKNARHENEGPEQDEQSAQRSAVQLEFAETKENNRREDEAEDDNERERKANAYRESADEHSKRKKKNDQEHENDYMRTKKIDRNPDEEQSTRPRIDAHADHIETHYKSGQSIKHNDDNWDNKYRRTPQEEAAKAAPAPERTLEMLKKADLGEQTIDYRKLKEQFDAISIGSDGKLKMTNAVYSDDSFSSKKKGPIYYREDIPASDEVVADDEAAENKAEVDQIYQASVNGLDFVIQILSLYEDKEKQEEDFFTFTQQHLWAKFQAHSCFFVKRPESSHYESISQTEITPDKQQVMSESFSFEQIKEAKFESWALMSLPYWLDHTFQAADQFFFFPYTEGTQKIGFVTLHFFSPIEESKAAEVEIILESLRGIYLQIFHKTGLEGEYLGKQTKVEEKTNMLSKLMFWKKAG